MYLFISGSKVDFMEIMYVSVDVLVSSCLMSGITYFLPANLRKQENKSLQDCWTVDLAGR